MQWKPLSYCDLTDIRYMAGVSQDLLHKMVGLIVGSPYACAFAVRCESSNPRNCQATTRSSETPSYHLPNKLSWQQPGTLLFCGTMHSSKHLFLRCTRFFLYRYHRPSQRSPVAIGRPHPPSRKAATMKAYSQYTPLTRSEDQTAPRKADCEPITLSVAESSSVPVWVASSLSRCLVSALIYWRHDHRCVINSQRYFAFEQYV